MDANTTGGNNTAVGVNALGANTTASKNVAVGGECCLTLNGGDENVAVGYLSMRYSTTAARCTALGYNTLGNQTTGQNNVAIGYHAGVDITTGNNNIAIGSQSLETNSTAHDNIAIGYKALEAGTTGADNVVIGSNAGDAQTDADGNVLIGKDAGGALQTAAYNVLIGYNCGTSLGDHNYNVAVGEASFSGSYGEKNVCIGRRAGQDNTDVNASIFIGNDAGMDLADGDDYRLFIARQDTNAGNSACWIKGIDTGACYQGNNSSTWSTTSDRRLKKNIVDNTKGLAEINQLRITSFEYRTREEIDMSEFPKANEPRKVVLGEGNEGVHTGVIAQEIEDILPECIEVSDFGAKTVNNDPITWALVNAVKELSTQNDALKARLDAAGL